MTRHFLPRALLAAAATVVLVACSTTQGVNVSTDYDKSTNFQQYRTYDWYAAEPVNNQRPGAGAGTATGTTTGTAAGDNPAAAAGGGSYDTFADRRIRAALDAQLPGKGLTRATAKPDLRIAYDISVKTEQQADPTYAFAPGFGYGYSYWYGYRYNYGVNRFGPGAQAINTYNVGTVVVDFVDAKANELIWRGVGESVVDPGSVTEESINQIVVGILAKYPPKPKN